MKLLKRWLTRIFVTIGIISVIPPLVIYFFSAHVQENRLNGKDSVVLTINLASPITEAPSQSNFSLFNKRGISLLELISTLKLAKKDPRVKGIVINGKANNMGLAQMQEMRDAILNFQKSGKFAIFYTDSFGELTPGLKSYYFATACKEIWMQPSGELNLTGIQLEIPFLAKVLKEWGVLPQIGTREEYKNALTFLTDENFTPANEESFKSLAKGIYEQFVAGIQKDREIPKEALENIMQNTPLLGGTDAQKLDLVDQLVFEDELEERVKKQVNGPVKLLKIRHYEEAVQGEKSKLYDKLTTKNEDQQRIALVFGTGEIVRSSSDSAWDMGESPNQLTPLTIRRAVDGILKDPSIKAVIFRIDSPGGSPVASDSILHSIQRLKAKKIPLIISMGNAAASGGYWIAASADHILASPLTITGSIGVVGGKISFAGLAEKLKVNVGIVTEGSNSQMWSQVVPYTPAQWDALQKNLDRLYQNFLNIVVQGRKLTPEHVREVAKGRAWLGFEAREFGLVDEIGGLESAINKAKSILKIPTESLVSIEIYPRPKSLKEKLKSILEGEENDADSFFDDMLSLVHMVRMLLNPAMHNQGVKATIPEVK